MGKLVQYPGLRERERAIEQVIIEGANLPGVEAIEAADREDLGIGDGSE